MEGRVGEGAGMEGKVDYSQYSVEVQTLCLPESAKLDSLGILTKLFEGTEFCKNIEAIMGIMARAMVIIGIESVVESWVSVMKLTTVKTDLLVKRLLCL